MLLGCIADDFTGASDLANTLARGGMRAAQFVGVPDGPAPADCEAGVVALKSRSVAPGAAVAASLAALGWLRAQGCRRFLFKVCSTFDSTPEGNIGPVGEALAAALGARGVVVCPAFPAAGRTVYQGHLFVGDRLLSESGLESHPLNPMTDPDLRRWLARQCAAPVGLLPLAALRAGGAGAALAAAAAAGAVLVIADAVADEDLRALAVAAGDAPLLVGGSGIALGVPEALARAGARLAGPAPYRGVPGPGVALAGSCSRATRAQVAAHAAAHPSLAVDVDAAVAARAGGGGGVEALAAGHAAFLLERAAERPLLHSSQDPSGVAAAQARHGAAAVAGALDALFGAVARRLVAGGARRLAVAGGETSGAVVEALDLGALDVGPEIDPGVPVMLAPARPPGRERVALALKSGNFGAPDFFAKALDRMERDA